MRRLIRIELWLRWTILSVVSGVIVAIVMPVTAVWRVLRGGRG